MTSDHTYAAPARPIPPAAEDRSFDVVVIGAGQAGLAMAWHLKLLGIRFLVLEAAPALGQVWRSRWDSLTLFTPAQYDSLPGMRFPAAADTYPGKDDVADYLQQYATRHQLPVRLSAPVRELRRSGTAFEIRTDDETFSAAEVVVATGPFQVPFIPPLAAGLDPDVPQLHSAAYRNPQSLPGGRVLVVGGGNSGMQIADELIATRPVELALGSAPPALPQRFLGKDLFWWAAWLRLIEKSADSRIGRRMQADELVIGTNRRTLRRAGVAFRPRLTGLAGSTASFADGSTAEVEAVIWATGFRPDYAWLHIDDVLTDAGPTSHRGVSDVPGLYFLGLPFQYSRGSALLGFVRHDAAYLAERVGRRAGTAAARGGTTPRPRQGD
jgi:putative flavoprotein involved in K+ transport